uniref:COesterase domain-containing protein n=1 Tax=Strongyloides papillosus TaxID=174720 RepID=A0A0N5BCH2_STREA
MQGDEIMDIFAYPFRHSKRYDKKALKNEQKYSKTLILLIREFSKSGHPSKRWAKFKDPNTTAFVFNGKLDLKKSLKQKDVLPLCSKVNCIIINTRRKLQNEVIVTTTTQATTTTKKKSVFDKIKVRFKEHF